MRAKMTSYITAHRVEVLLVCLILSVAGFLRLYQIDGYMRFLGDEGRDALAVLRLVRYFDPPLIGPVTSVGNMYLGPLYYYMMAVPMALTNLNPIAAAVMVAMIGIVTVGLVYYVGKTLFSPVAGFVAASLYATAYLPVSMATSSWNPYPMPLFALLVVVSLYKLLVTKNSRWLIMCATALAFALQMHLLGLLLIPFVVVSIAWHYFKTYTAKASFRPLIRDTVIGVGVFALLMSPLLLFDLSHNFLNFNNFQKFFENRESTVNLNPLRTVGEYWDTFANLYVSKFLTYQYPWLGLYASVIVPIFTILFGYRDWLKTRQIYGVGLLGLWVVFGIVGMSLVKSHVYDHYFGFIMPAIFLLVGYVFWKIWEMGKVLQVSVIGITILLVIVNLSLTPLHQPPGHQLQRTQTIAQYVIMAAENKPFNFALIADHNYDDGYQFYFEKWRAPMRPIDAQRFDETKTDQLFVVCEEVICNPINNDRGEIAQFGWAKIDQETVINGVRIFKLVTTEMPPETMQE